MPVISKISQLGDYTGLSNANRKLGLNSQLKTCRYFLFLTVSHDDIIIREIILSPPSMNLQ